MLSASWICFYSLSHWPLTSVSVASDTLSLRSTSVPSDLQRGREVLLLLTVALIRWAAMLWDPSLRGGRCAQAPVGFSLNWSGQTSTVSHDSCNKQDYKENAAESVSPFQVLDYLRVSEKLQHHGMCRLMLKMFFRSFVRQTQWIGINILFVWFQ